MKGQGNFVDSSKNYISVKIGCSNSLHFHKFLNANFGESSSILTSLLTLTANEKKDDLFLKKLAYPYKKIKSFDSFFERSALERKVLYSPSKQSTASLKELWKT